MKLRDRRRLAFLDGGLRLAGRDLASTRSTSIPFPHQAWPLPALHHITKERNSLIRHFPPSVMNTLDYPRHGTSILRPRNLALAEGPKSDCCIAPLTRVGDELYACSACGSRSDDTLSMRRTVHLPQTPIPHRETWGGGPTLPPLTFPFPFPLFPMHFSTFVIIGKHDDPENAVARSLEPFDDAFETEPYRDYLDSSDISYMAEHYGIPATDLHALAAKMEDWRGSTGGVDPRGLYAITTYNPDGKWDWYEIGGRWNGSIPGSRECHQRTGPARVPSPPGLSPPLPRHARGRLARA